jgi:hypothetical protein
VFVWNRTFLAFCLNTLAVSALSASTLVAYLSAPGQTSSIVAGVEAETFNDLSLIAGLMTYNYVIGVYSAVSPNSYGQTVARIPVVAADQYGGADGTDYMYAGQRQTGGATTVDLVLSQASN